MVKGDMATHDHERISLNLARMNKGGKNFEIAVDADLAIKLKHGKEIDVKEVIQGDHIFSDVKRGELASEQDLNKIFNTQNVYEIAEIIIKEGQVQLTADYRKQLMNEKRKKIIAIIHRNSVDTLIDRLIYNYKESM